MKKETKIIIGVVSISSLLLLLFIIVAGIFFLPTMLNNKNIQEETKDENKEIIKGVPVVAMYNEEAYVIEGLPETVDITLIGNKKDVEEIKEFADNEVRVDLTEYEASEKTIKIKLEFNNANQVEYKIDPSSVEIKIYNKISDVKQINLKIDELEIASNLVIQNIDLQREEIIVRGSSKILESINRIKPNLVNKMLQINNEGSYTLKNIPLIALDKEGKQIKNIEIVPGMIDVNISVIESKDIFTKTIKKNISTKYLKDGLTATVLQYSDIIVEIEVSGKED